MVCGVVVHVCACDGHAVVHVMSALQAIFSLTCSLVYTFIHTLTGTSRRVLGRSFATKNDQTVEVIDCCYDIPLLESLQCILQTEAVQEQVHSCYLQCDKMWRKPGFPHQLSVPQLTSTNFLVLFSHQRNYKVCAPNCLSVGSVHGWCLYRIVWNKYSFTIY